MGAGSPTVATSVHDMTGMPPLDAGAVHLWVIDVSRACRDARTQGAHGEGRLGPDSDAVPGALRSLTSPAERERAARFRRPGDGERFLAVRAALRQLLAQYLACEPLALSFRYGERGKPSLPGTPLCFNLSHSDALALVAVAHGRQVGVDVERQREIADLDGIAMRICTPQEREELDAVAPAERQGAFLAMWTRKEALAKMTGDGIRAVSRDAGPGRQVGCRLEQVTDLPGYAACVAAQGRDWRLVRCTWTVDRFPLYD